MKCSVTHVVGNLNNETEKSKQTLSLNIKIFFTMCAVKGFKNCNTKLDDAELLFLSILFQKIHLLGFLIFFINVGKTTDTCNTLNLTNGLVSMKICL